MVRLYDYDVPAADDAAGIPSLRPLLEASARPTGVRC